MYFTKQLVLNWHITEVCNYKCQYCYAKWDDVIIPRELIHDPIEAKKLLKELIYYFSPNKKVCLLNKHMKWKQVRLNIAGGEPLLYLDKILPILESAKSLGFKLSIITNASKLDYSAITKLAPLISILGISIDSTNVITNEKIGRNDKFNSQINLESLISNLNYARLINPKIKLKINTVVNSLNFQEDFSNLLNKVNPDKWKALRMLPVINNHLCIDQDKYLEFINNHKSFSHILQIEDHDEMTNSYIMIDPHGRFFQNQSNNQLNSGYSYSHMIQKVGAKKAFEEITFDISRFNQRYNQSKN